jgi:hypothetical protein
MMGSVRGSGTGRTERELAEARRQLSEFGLERRKMEAEMASLRGRSNSKDSSNSEPTSPLCISNEQSLITRSFSIRRSTT